MDFSKKVLSVLLLQVVLNIRLTWTVKIESLLNVKVAVPVFDPVDLYNRLKDIEDLAGDLKPIDMEIISAGALLGMKECEKVFKWEKWNCPRSIFLRQTKSGPTKEKAYAEAIVAAAVVYQITKNCSKGLVENCGCDQRLKGSTTPTFNKLMELNRKNTNNTRNEKPDWVWGGCSDNTTYAENVFTKYLEQLENDQDAQSFISRHNNIVGRNLIRESMEKQCRCHGVSGSCLLQSCWMQIIPFEKIAQKLFERYKRATKISFEGKENNELAVGNSGRFPPELLRQLPTKGLIYLETSPNYCEVNGSVWNGTAGRMCASTTMENFKDSKRKNCRKLCRRCGREVKKHERIEFYQCNCKFIWCCEAKCDFCQRTVTEFYCQ